MANYNGKLLLKFNTSADGWSKYLGDLSLSGDISNDIIISPETDSDALCSNNNYLYNFDGIPNTNTTEINKIDPTTAIATHLTSFPRQSVTANDCVVVGSSLFITNHLTQKIQSVNIADGSYRDLASTSSNNYYGFALATEINEIAQLVFYDNNRRDIPGWDHVGLNLNGKIYESWPGSGPRNTLTYREFMSQEAEEFHVIDIDYDLALKMSTIIDGIIKPGDQFQYLNHYTIGEIYTNLSPWAQKGGNDTFTCIGLLEWAAEKAGHNWGQGFIPDWLEAFGHVAYHHDYDLIPILSPFLLAVVADPQYRDNYVGFSEDADVLFGLIDPVDFILTDPLGRRLGYTEDVGYLNEIPGAFYSGDGIVEEFIIFNSTNGKYKLELFGLGEKSEVIVGNFQDVLTTSSGLLGSGQTVQLDFISTTSTMLQFIPSIIGSSRVESD